MSDTNNASPAQGKLYLIPTMLGDIAPLEVLPISIKKAVERIDHYIVENEKSARAFIKRIKPGKAQGSLHIEQLNKYTDPIQVPSFLDPCFEGKDVGLISEAGCPAIADPGADVVAVAHSSKIKVVPLVGPSSILMAMMGSGLNGQSFAFNGYLPIENSERTRAIKRLEKISRDHDQSQIFIETPYRNEKLLAELLKKLSPNTRLCLATNISLPDQMIVTREVSEWKMVTLDIDKKPTVFIIHA